MLVGCDIEVGLPAPRSVRSFSSSLPPDLTLCASFGRKVPMDLATAGTTQLRALLLRSADTQISPAGWWISRA